MSVSTLRNSGSTLVQGRLETHNLQVRIISTESYALNGLFIMDAGHGPSGCAVQGNFWLAGGELDNIKDRSNICDDFHNLRQFAFRDTVYGDRTTTHGHKTVPRQLVKSYLSGLVLPKELLQMRFNIRWSTKPKDFVCGQFYTGSEIGRELKEKCRFTRKCAQSARRITSSSQHLEKDDLASIGSRTQVALYHPPGWVSAVDPRDRMRACILLHELDPAEYVEEEDVMKIWGNAGEEELIQERAHLAIRYRPPRSQETDSESGTKRDTTGP
ncbi:hypothetical protein C8R43DRAFT_954253 [Mycena crocata]|nr:hypothetical protein C8R43DRAFT_954253 [Mycena crocata]